MPAPTTSVRTQAQALQQQLKDWFAGLLGPGVKLPELPWRVTGEHDHYVITWPIPGLTSPAGEVATTVNARPLDGGRWSIDAVKMPPSGAFTMTIPNAGDDGKGASVDLQFSIGRQDTHGVIDPALASASSLHAEIGDLVVSSNSAKQHQEQRFDRYVADTSLTPAQNGRLDLNMDATMGGWKSASEINGGTPLAIGIQTMRAVGRISGVNRERVAGTAGRRSEAWSAHCPPTSRRSTDKSDLPDAGRAAAAPVGRLAAGHADRRRASRKRWTGCRSRSPEWAGCR